MGGILGLEREWKQKPAGFRTNMIITGSAALLVSLDRVVIVVVGVSFIGAGTILKSSSDQVVRYLTTTATILIAAGIGISIALKQYWLGVETTFILVIINY